MRKNLKNYTSGWTVNRSLNEIQSLLVAKGAERMMIEYKDKEPVGLTFAIQTPKGMMPVQLPARFEKVVKVMYGTTNVNETQLEQAKRTAWRNLYDWVDAQMALLETEMVKLEEVFLPYVVMKGRTVFEHFESGNLLGSGSYED